MGLELVHFEREGTGQFCWGKGGAVGGFACAVAVILGLWSRLCRWFDGAGCWVCG